MAPRVPLPGPSAGPSAALAAACAVLLVGWKVNSTWLIAAGLAFGVRRWLVG